MNRYRSFHEFWPFYLQEHSKRGTKLLHFAGTMLLFVWIAIAILQRSPFFLLAAVVNAYGFAWVAHFVIEKNRPATFQYPLYSLLGDFKMCALILARPRSMLVNHRVTETQR